MALADVQSTIRRRPLERLAHRLNEHSEVKHKFDFVTPVDRSRWYVCPTLTPLYYAPVYAELTESQKRRYNQLTALSFSELIAFFETTFIPSVLAALAKNRCADSDELVECLQHFVAEEQEHTRWWRQLNRLSEPELYAKSENAIIRLPVIAEMLLRQVTKRPTWFPFVFWVMLALEERSLEISRRCIQLPPEEMEPHYLAIYRTHLSDEVRHVQIDWHLIERYYAGRSAAMREINARLLRLAIRVFFLPPTRSAVRVTEHLIHEHPDLKPLRREMRQQLGEVSRDPGYQQMMYSRESTPITFALFDRFPEFHKMRYVLQSYQPRVGVHHDGC
jgi:P-aminobenzoate N-oxygenase AurF